MAFLVFYVTHPDEETARSIAAHLLQKRLIACSNILPVTSAFWWQGVISSEGEWISILKTRLDLEERVETEILKIHPYQTPCILRFEVRANAEYEAWITAETVAAS